MFFKSRYELSSYGEEFANSFIVVKLLDKQQIFKYNREVSKASKGIKDDNTTEETVEASEEIINLMYKWIAEQFVEGKIHDEGKDRDMTKDDIDSLPVPVIKDLSQLIQGSLEKKD